MAIDNRFDILIKYGEVIKLYPYFSARCLSYVQFFDPKSQKLLDEKIRVFQQLRDGKKPSEIESFLDILELYPRSEDGLVLW